MTRRGRKPAKPIEEIVLALMQDIRDGADPEHLQRFVERGLADPDGAAALPEAMRRLDLAFTSAPEEDPYADSSPLSLRGAEHRGSTGMPARTVVVVGTPIERMLGGILR